MKWVKLKNWIRKNKLLMPALAVGMLLMLLPAAWDTQEEQQTVAAEDGFSLEEQEEKLQKILSRIQGAGEVSVLLSVSDQGRVTLAENREESTDETGQEVTREVIVLSDGDRAERTAVLQQTMPTYKGALIVADGADTAEIRLKITRAVQSVTGLSSDKITVIR